MTGQQATVVVAAAGNRGTNILMATVMAVYIGRVGTPFAVSLVIAVFFFGRMVFAPIWGAIADVTGNRRGVLVVSSAFAALSILPLSVVDGIWGPLALRTLFAVFAAGFIPVMFTIMNEQGGATGRGQAVGLVSSAAAVGSTFGRSASGPLIDFFTRGTVYLLLAGLAAVVVVGSLLIEDPTPANGVEDEEQALLPAIRNRLLPSTGASFDHLRINGLHWLYVASFLRNANVLGMMSLLPVYLVSHLDISPVMMGIILGINPAVQMVGMYAFGKFSDGSGRKGLIVGGLAGSGAYALIMASASLFPSVAARSVVAGAGLFTLGIAYSGLQIGVITFIGDVAPIKRESELIGLRSTARGLGGVVAPPLFGIGTALVGYEVTFAVASLLSFASALLVARRLVESHEPAPEVSVGND